MKITPVTWTSRMGVSCRTANANTAPSTRRKMPGPMALLLSTALPTYQRHRILTPHDGHIAGRGRVDEDVTAPGSAPPEPVSAEAPPLRGPVLMHQDWCDLTYVHWAVDPGRLTRFMPPAVRPDVHDGTSWVGLVPFRMVDAAPGRGRPVPWLGTFLETNVRLYSVDDAGRRGVVFLSLDCDRLAVVLAARGVLGVPYRWARLRHRVTPLPGGVERHTYEDALPRSLPRSVRRIPGPGQGSRPVVDAGPRS